ncbi:MAG: helix-hairpin-helix domain-containing protein, partial [Candidatus Omnitrophica bacterium]|nr:helix-hairpin-helix domain-containing protein [Candidatus Omnitrophota bacterium]
MDNLLVAGIFRDVAKILEIKGENVFRIRAYERAALNIESLSEDIANLAKEDKLNQIPGIGKDLAEKISEIVRTGKLKFLKELERSIPEGLLELLEIPSIGPKTANLLYKELKVRSVADLEKAIEKGKLNGLPGIKEKTIQNIERGIEILKKGKERMLLSVAYATAEEFITKLKKLAEIKKISAAGSLRRQKDTVRDIDILVVSRAPGRVMDSFTSFPQVKTVQAKGATKSSVLTADNVQVDLRVVEEKSFGAALFYFTGSKNFNIKIRQLAIKKGYKLNEYGLFSGKGKERFIAGRSEEEIFTKLGLSYVEPELREDRGEIELAKKGKLPHLIELSDIRGDLHVHSDWSDGSNTIEEMVAAAIKRGYGYIAVTDHSQSLKVAGGLSLEELKKKKAEIEKINKGLKNFKVLFATEVDIDSGGNLDYPDDTLRE